MATKYLQVLFGLLCVCSIAANRVEGLPTEQSRATDQTNLIRRSPIYGNTVSRHRVDIALKANQRSANASNQFRSGNVVKAVGSKVGGAIEKVPVIQGAIAHGRTMRKGAGF